MPSGRVSTDRAMSCRRSSAGSRVRRSTGSASARFAAPRSKRSVRQPMRRSASMRSTTLLWKWMNSRCSCETMMFSSLRGSPIERAVLVVARQVVDRRRSTVLLADQQLQPRSRFSRAPICVRVVQERLVERPGAVQRVEVEAGRAEVAQRVRVVVALELRRRIERDVVVDELAEVGVPAGSRCCRSSPVGSDSRHASHRAPSSRGRRGRGSRPARRRTSPRSGRRAVAARARALRRALLQRLAERRGVAVPAAARRLLA